MGPLDVAWHLLNLIAPALGLGLLSSTATKLIWRRELAAVRWSRLAAWTCSVSALTAIAGLVVTGHDGRMGTYACMVLACALALSWAGFRPGRR